jgi:3-oxoacyl-[acyl-carrier-protein] synthase II
VVTGLGIVSPVGNDIPSAWANIVVGNSGIGPVTRFDASAFPTRIAGEVKNFDLAAYMSPKEARRFDTFIHYGIAAGTQALHDSGIEVNDSNADRIGVVVGSGIGGLPMIEDTHAELVAQGVRRVSPFFVPGSIINMISGQLSIMFGLRGPNYAVVSACTTGLHCIGDAARMIQHDDADVIVAGGAESTISPLGLGGFCAARALSTRNEDPTAASRPWDRDRDGFVLGEGAGVMAAERAFEKALAVNSRHLPSLEALALLHDTQARSSGTHSEKSLYRDFT